MKKLRILITSESGYLGLVLTNMYVHNGHNIKAVDIFAFNIILFSNFFLKKT